MPVPDGPWPPLSFLVTVKTLEYFRLANFPSMPLAPIVIVQVIAAD